MEMPCLWKPLESARRSGGSRRVQHRRRPSSRGQCGGWSQEPPPGREKGPGGTVVESFSAAGKRSKKPMLFSLAKAVEMAGRLRIPAQRSQRESRFLRQLENSRSLGQDCYRQYPAPEPWILTKQATSTANRGGAKDMPGDPIQCHIIGTPMTVAKVSR